MISMLANASLNVDQATIQLFVSILILMGGGFVAMQKWNDSRDAQKALIFTENANKQKKEVEEASDKVRAECMAQIKVLESKIEVANERMREAIKHLARAIVLVNSVEDGKLRASLQEELRDVEDALRF